MVLSDITQKKTHNFTLFHTFPAFLKTSKQKSTYAVSKLEFRAKEA